MFKIGISNIVIYFAKEHFLDYHTFYKRKDVNFNINEVVNMQQEYIGTL